MSDIQEAINKLVRVRRKKPLRRPIRPPVLGSSGRAATPPQEPSESVLKRLIGRLFGTDNPGGFPAEPGSSYANLGVGWVHGTEADPATLEVGNCYYSGSNGVTISWHWGTGDRTGFTNCQKYARDSSEFLRGLAHSDSGNIYNNSNLLLRHPFYDYEDPPGTFPFRDFYRCLGACLSGSWIVAAFTVYSTPTSVFIFWHPVTIEADQTLTLPGGSDWWGPGGAGTAGYSIGTGGWVQQFIGNSVGTSMVSITDATDPRQICRVTITPDPTDPIVNPPSVSHLFEPFGTVKFSAFEVDYTIVTDLQTDVCQNSGWNNNQTTTPFITYSLSGDRCKVGGAPGETEVWEECHYVQNTVFVADSGDIRKKYQDQQADYTLNPAKASMLVAIDFDPMDVEIVVTLDFTLTFSLNWRYEQKSESIWSGGGAANSSVNATTNQVSVDCNGQQTLVDVADTTLIPNSAVWTQVQNDESSRVIEVDGHTTFRADLKLNGVSRLDLGIVDDLYRTRSKDTDTSPGSGNGTRTITETRQPTHGPNSSGQPPCGEPVQIDHGRGAFITPGDTVVNSSGDWQVCQNGPMPDPPDLPTLQTQWNLSGAGSRLTRFFRVLTFMDVKADAFVYHERKGEGLERYTPFELFNWVVSNKVGQQPPDQEFGDLIVGLDKKATVKSADPTGTNEYVYITPLSSIAKPSGTYDLEIDPLDFISLGGRFLAPEDGELFGGENFSGCSIYATNDILISAHQPLEMLDGASQQVELRFAALYNPTGDPFDLAAVSDTGPLVGNVSKI